MTSYQHQPLEFGGTLQDASARGIPWINLGEGVTPHPAMLNYTADASQIQEVFDSWLVDRLKEKAGDSTPKLLMMGAPQAALSAAEEGKRLEEDMTEAGVDVVVNHDLDLENLEQDTIDTIRQTLQQHPDLTAVWTICDFCVPIEAQAVRSVPEEQRPLVTGNFSTENTVDLIRSGEVEGVVDVPWEQFGWIALDQAARHWATGEPLPEENVVSDYPIDLGEPYVLDAETAGSSGPVPIYGPDFPAFFEAKWSEEYGG
jgi:ABC-type sugar transport system substrate-binding protein